MSRLPGCRLRLGQIDLVDGWPGLQARGDGDNGVEAGSWTKQTGTWSSEAPRMFSQLLPISHERNDPACVAVLVHGADIK